MYAGNKQEIERRHGKRQRYDERKHKKGREKRIIFLSTMLKHNVENNESSRKSETVGDTLTEIKSDQLHALLASSHHIVIFKTRKNPLLNSDPMQGKMLIIKIDVTFHQAIEVLKKAFVIRNNLITWLDSLQTRKLYVK